MWHPGGEQWFELSSSSPTLQLWSLACSYPCSKVRYGTTGLPSILRRAWLWGGSPYSLGSHKMRTSQPSASWHAVAGLKIGQFYLHFLSLESLKALTNKRICNLESLLPCLEFWEYQENVPFIHLPAGRWSQVKLFETSIDLGAQREKQEVPGIE